MALRATSIHRGDVATGTAENTLTFDKIFRFRPRDNVLAALIFGSKSDNLCIVHARVVLDFFVNRIQITERKIIE